MNLKLARRILALSVTKKETILLRKNKRADEKRRLIFIREETPLGENPKRKPMVPDFWRFRVLHFVRQYYYSPIEYRDKSRQNSRTVYSTDVRYHMRRRVISRFVRCLHHFLSVDESHASAFQRSLPGYTGLHHCPIFSSNQKSTETWRDDGGRTSPFYSSLQLRQMVVVP